MLVHFDPPWICLHDGGSISLAPPDPIYRYFRSGGSVDRFRGEKNPTWHRQPFNLCWACL